MNDVTDISVEGYTLPNKPLTNFQLLDAVKALKIKNFRGVFCKDELPSKPKVNECAVINLDDSTGGGTHWCCYFKKGNVKLYFDSYGLSPPNEIVAYLKQPIYYNSERVQPDNSVICANLCLYIIKKL